MIEYNEFIGQDDLNLQIQRKRISFSEDMLSCLLIGMDKTDKVKKSYVMVGPNALGIINDLANLRELTTCTE